MEKAINDIANRFDKTYRINFADSMGEHNPLQRIL